MKRDPWPPSYKETLRAVLEVTKTNTHGLSGVYHRVHDQWTNPDLTPPTKDYVKGIAAWVGSTTIREAVSVSGLQGRGPAIIITTIPLESIIPFIRDRGVRPEAAWKTPTKVLDAIRERGPPEVRPGHPFTTNPLKIATEP